MRRVYIEEKQLLPRVIITDYLQSIINEIDIDAETIFANNDKQLSENDRDYINLTRQRLIDEINFMKEYNARKYVDNVNDKAFQDWNNEYKIYGPLPDLMHKIKGFLFKQYCFYLDSKIFGEQSHKLGVLVITDWYMTRNEVEHIKYLVRSRYEDERDDNGTAVYLCVVNVLNEDFIRKLNFQARFHVDNIVRQSNKKRPNIVRLHKLDTSNAIKLDLNNLRIHQINCSFLEKFQSLHYLNLSSNKIVKADFNTLGNLRELNLRNNSLKEVHFAKENNLKVLDLSHNRLNLSYTMLENLVNIEKLNLSGNSTGNIFLGGAYFRTFTNLKCLHLTKNKIQMICKKMFNGLDNLEELYLDYNELTDVDFDEFSNLKKLKLIDLCGNGIKSIKHTGSPNLSCETLNLSKNNLISIQATIFEKFKNLKILELEGCLPEKKFPIINFLKNLTKLEELKLGYNKIETKSLDFLMDGSFDSLKILDLSQNCINKLDARLFLNLKKLTNLNLSFNNIEEILDSTFPSNLSNLMDLNLSYNNISKIDMKAFYNLERLVHLHLDGNSKIFIWEASKIIAFDKSDFHYLEL